MDRTEYKELIKTELKKSKEFLELLKAPLQKTWIVRQTTIQPIRNLKEWVLGDWDQWADDIVEAFTYGGSGYGDANIQIKMRAVIAAMTTIVAMDRLVSSGREFTSAGGMIQIRPYRQYLAPLSLLFSSTGLQVNFQNSDRNSSELETDTIMYVCQGVVLSEAVPILDRELGIWIWASSSTFHADPNVQRPIHLRQTGMHSLRTINAHNMTQALNKIEMSTAAGSKLLQQHMANNLTFADEGDTDEEF